MRVPENRESCLPVNLVNGVIAPFPNRNASAVKREELIKLVSIEEGFAVFVFVPVVVDSIELGHE